MGRKGKEGGFSPNDTRGGKRTMSPSHKVIDPIESGEAKLWGTPRDDAGMKSLIAELRDAERMGKSRQ
jgi:hypothetical protein